MNTLYIAILIMICPIPLWASPIHVITDCETLTGWASSATLTTDAHHGQHAVVAPIPADGVGFINFDHRHTGIDLSNKHSLAFWWKVEGHGMQDLKIKIRNYPLVGGMEAVYDIWTGQNPLDGWQLATVELARPQYDSWGGQPDLTRRYITFRTVSGANANARLFIDHIVAVDETFSWSVEHPVREPSPIEQADFTQDGQVGFADFLIFAQAFGTSQGDPGFDPRCDLNGDGAIGFGDFLMFAQLFGSDGMRWVIPLTMTNKTPEALPIELGITGILHTETLPAGADIVLRLPLPRAHLSGRDPSNTFPVSLWAQVAGAVQTRQQWTAYLPQSGPSRTYQQFVDALQTGDEPILPDFSYSGYHYFAKPIPDVQADTFNVIDYGAVPNDGQSDQLAIQRAIDAASRNRGGIVFFPPGEYLVNTDADNNRSILIGSSNIILRGSGSRAGGTIIRMVNHMPPTNPDQLWSSPYMFIFRPTNAPERFLANVVASARRETFELVVDNAAQLYPGQWIMVHVNSHAAIPEFLDSYQIEPAWTTLRFNGIQVRERHRIADIQGNRIRLAEPLRANVNALHNWTVREYNHIEEVGVEDICFMGEWLDFFVHHKDAIHDGGWSLLQFSRCVNAWVRRCSFINVNRALDITTSSAVSVYHVTQAGNMGHSSISCSGGYGVWIGLSEDLAGHHHGPGSSSRATGTVYWRYDMQPGQYIDAHGAQPYANLLDRVNGGVLYGSGASIENFPNHLKHYVLWNFLHRGSHTHYDFWRPGNARDRFVKPIIVGFHGDPVTFNEATLQVNESQGRMAEPESLFEAQLELRLGTVPFWLNDLRAEWEHIRQTPLPNYSNPNF